MGAYAELKKYFDQINEQEKTQTKTVSQRILNESLTYRPDYSAPLSEKNMKFVSGVPENSMPVQWGNWQQRDQLKKQYESAVRIYGENSTMAKKAKQILDALVVRDEDEFNVKKDIVNPAIGGTLKGASFGLAGSAMADPQTEISDSSLASLVGTAGELVGSIASSGALYGIANKALAGVKAFQAIDKVSPFLGSMVRGQIADLVIQSPITISRSVQEGKSADEVFVDWAKDQAVNAAFNAVFAGFESIPRIKEAVKKLKAAPDDVNVQKEVQRAVQEETAKRFTQVETSVKPGELPIERVAREQLDNEIKALNEPKAKSGIPLPTDADAPPLRKITEPSQIPATEIDPFLVKNKVNLVDYVRTPEKVLKKIGLGKEGRMLVDGYNAYQLELPKEISKISEWVKQVENIPGAERNIFKALDGQINIAELSKTEQKVAKEMKKYFSNWADRLGIPSDKRITNYITHIFDDELIAKEFSDDIAKLITDKVPGSVYNPFLQQRYGIEGFKEDAFAAAEAYTKRAVRKAHMDPALDALQKASNNLPLDSQRYVAMLGARINLRPTQIDSLIDNFIKSTPIGYKLGARPTAFVTRKARNLVYKGTLGFNGMSALRNLTQTTNTFAELGSKWTLKGYGDTFRAMRDKSDELIKNGVLSGEFIQDKKITAVKKTLDKLDKSAFWMFEKAEEINRGVAYYGAKAKALSGGLSEAEAIKQGVEMARKTQFTFGSVDTPVAMQSDLMKTLFQFQNFNLKQSEYLVGMAKDAVQGLKKGDLKAAVPAVRWIGANVVVWYVFSEMMGLNFDLTDNIPFVDVVTGDQKLGKTPLTSAIGDFLDASTGKPDQYGNTNPDVASRFANVARNNWAQFVPGGVQARKTIQGVQAVAQSGSYNKSGNLQYAVDQNAWNAVMAAIFGKSALPEAKKRWSGEEKTLSKKQTEAFDKAKEIGVDPVSVYDAIQGIRKLEPENGKKTVSKAQKRKYLATKFSGDELLTVIKLLVDGEENK